MSRIRDLPGGAWLAIGLAASALIVPAAAVAARNVGIIGSNGNTAKVTTSGSLQVAEATPASFKEFVHLGSPSTTCTKVATVPGCGPGRPRSRLRTTTHSHSRIPGCRP